MSILLRALWDPDWRLSVRSGGAAQLWSRLNDPQLSRALLSGLLVFASFSPDGAYRGVADVARMLEMSPSTTQRYIRTLAAVGLLDREPGLRKYRIARLG